MLEIALILVLAAHLVLVNLAMTGPLGALGLEWYGARSGNRDVSAIGRQLAWWSLAALTLAMLLGGALLVLEWSQANSHYWETLQAVRPSQLWFALAELGFYLIAMMAYLWLSGATRGSRIAQRVLAIFAATNLMYHFPPLFTVLSMVAKQPELQGVVLDRPALRGMMMQGPVVARVSHIWLASVAVLGLTMMVCAWLQQKRQSKLDSKSVDGSRVIAWGARLALATTLLQLPVGIWVMGELPSYETLLGSDVIATALFAISILCILRLLTVLVALALGDHEPRQIFESVGITLTVVTLMTAVLHRVDRDGDRSDSGRQQKESIATFQ